MYHERFYRSSFDTQRFQSINICDGESDLWIGWNARGENVGPDEVKSFAEKTLSVLRSEILQYDRTHRGFIETLEPLPQDENAPSIICSMLKAALAADVGPMASVAGAIAEYLGKALDDAFHFDEIVVENGGDFWLKINSPLSIGVYAGLSSLSGNIAVVLHADNSPLGLACSSGTVGPSLSYGKADAALVIAKDAAAADSWATALGNRIKSQRDMEASLNWLFEDAGKILSAESLKPLGALIIVGDTMAAQGNITLGPAQ
ncbi:MAG: UPF0280 family protein [Treponema sp.]|jgi:ApbE superfamily uncharacterized protein (UPF0280 family)|nr:UPF0280 family protein [Treponema sp.]